jgi:hypothetical protein
MKWFADNFHDSISVEEFFTDIWNKQLFEPLDESEHPINNIVNRLNNYFGLIVKDDNVIYDPFINFILANYGELEMNPKLSGEYYNRHTKQYYYSTDFRAVYAKINAVLASKAYTYNKLLDTLELEYNPIWNVDSHEESIENRGSRHEVNNYGAKSSTENMGGRNETYNNGQKITETTPELTKKTFINGSKTDTKSLTNSGTVRDDFPVGKMTIDTKLNTQMDDANTFYRHDRNERIETPYSENYTNGQQTNTETPERVTNGNGKIDNKASQDRINKSPYKNIFEDGAHSDTTNKSSYKDSISITRQGNIGVKTSQSMINEEREVAKFNLLKRICKDVVHELTLSVYY